MQLIVPIGANVKTAYNFLASKEQWVRKHLKKAITPHKADGTIPIYGTPHKVIFSGEKISSLFKIENKEITVSKELQPSDLRVMLGALFKKILFQDIRECAAHLSVLLRVKYNRISLRDTKTQWGSCAHNGNLSFSWRLIFAPKFVMEYLVAHELCHLKERNHGPKFWQLVVQICPQYNSAKTWLRRHGRALHNIEFFN